MRSSAATVLLALLLGGALARPAVAESADSTNLDSPALSETANPDAAFTRAHDAWTGFDKVQHTTFSLLLVLSTQYMLENKAGWSERGALPLSVGLTATLGIAKELYDWRISSSRYFSHRDLVADVLGISLAFLVVQL